MSISIRAGVVSVLILAIFLVAWHIATSGTGSVQQMDPEYAKLMGLTATQGKSAMPGPLQVGAALWQHLSNPFYDNGPNDKGLGIQLAYSIARVGAGSAMPSGATRMSLSLGAVSLPFWEQRRSPEAALRVALTRRVAK